MSEIQITIHAPITPDDARRYDVTITVGRPDDVGCLASVNVKDGSIVEYGYSPGALDDCGKALGEAVGIAMTIASGTNPEQIDEQNYETPVVLRGDFQELVVVLFDDVDPVARFPRQFAAQAEQTRQALDALAATMLAPFGIEEVRVMHVGDVPGYPLQSVEEWARKLRRP